MFLMNAQAFIIIVTVWKLTLTFLFILNLQEIKALECPKHTNYSGPSLPYLPDSYQVSVECNILDKGYTSTAHIYYDFPGNRANLQYFANGIDRSLIFNYATDELFSVSNGYCNVSNLTTSNITALFGGTYTNDGYCTVSNLTTSNITALFDGYCTVSNLTTSNITALFGETYSNGLPHIASVQDVFKFGKKYGEIYIGNDTVRGLPVHHWQSCSNFSQFSTLVIDYYFSANWSTASTFSSVPVRAEVKAESTLSNGSVYTMHHIYDYFDFLPYIVQDDTIFQTPKDVICPGRKSSKALPKLPNNFYYRVEKVFFDLSAVVFEDVWYDERLKFYRRDYRPLAPEQPLNSVNPISEVHDYNTGVRYVLDQSTLDCKVVALDNYSMDATQNLTAKKVNGSFLLDMRNPLQLFNLDWNYTYIGQGTTRDIFCDVYEARRNDLFIDGFVSYSNLTITVYFLADEWTDVSDHLLESIESTQGRYGIPIKIDLLAQETGLSMTYNFVDFNPESPDFNVFDISQCYPEASKLTFQVTFPGTIDTVNRKTLVNWSHLIFAQTMGVSSIRVSNLKLDNDDASIFITSTLLDKTLPTAEFTYFPNKVAEKQDGEVISITISAIECAQFCVENPTFRSEFTYFPNKVVEKQDGEVISNTMSAIECAQFCVENPTFRCQSFDYCQDRTCRMSNVSFSNGKKLTNSTVCDHFARTVRARPPEKSITEAFELLRLSVYNRTLILSPQIDKTYTAVDVNIVFGWYNPKVIIPELPGQFSYKLQVTVPAAKQIYSSSVWYDSGFNLMRYDPHLRQPMYPFYSTNPLTVIEDFNTGIQYVIDKEYQNCTVSQLTPDEVGVFLSPNTTHNATWDLVMKDPFTTFRIDNTYKFVGQQTIRGMTCNLFESLRTDFRLPDKHPRPVQSVFRYAFLSDQWSEISDNYLGSVGQPIRLDITVLDDSLYLQYNFYDFDTDHPDISVYDIRQCNHEGNWKHFTVQFPGPFHPYLDTSSRMFLLESLFRVSNTANVSIIRLQGLRLDHDAVNIYLSGSLAEKHKTSLYFTKVPVSYVPEHVDDEISTAQDEDSCANACLDDTKIACNSFYFCPKSSQCLLSTKHVPDGAGQLVVQGCFSYSRTVDDSGIPISSTYAYRLLKNSVYSGNFTVNIPIPDTDQTKNYIAAGVTEQFTNIVTRSDGGNAMLEFTFLSNHSSFILDDAKTLTGLSIDECALACIDEGAFNCIAFSYTFKTQLCCFVDNFSVGKMNNFTDGSYMYLRKASKLYTMSPGSASQGLADTAVASINSNDDCAQLCTTNSKFDCKVFQYCTDTKQCLLFKERTIQASNQSTGMSTCYQYSSKLLTDFIATNAGLFVFKGVFNIQMVSRSDCANLCVQEQGSTCKGFYYAANTRSCYLTATVAGDSSGYVVSKPKGGEFCDVYTRNVGFYYAANTRSCYLTATAADDNSGHVVSNTKGGEFCDVYTRTYFPPSIPHPNSTSTPHVSTKLSSSQQSTSTLSTSSAADQANSAKPSVTARQTPRKPGQTPVTCIPPLIPSSTVVQPSQTSSGIGVKSTTTNSDIANTVAQQTGKGNSDVSSGLAVGIAFITFAVGIITGFIALHIYRRVRGLDEMKTNFLQHEEI